MSITRSSSAVDSEVTRRTGCGDQRLTTPLSGLVTALTMRGAISTPPFAMAPNACTSCSAVTLISWPMAMLCILYLVAIAREQIEKLFYDYMNWRKRIQVRLMLNIFKRRHIHAFFIQSCIFMR